MFPKMMDIIYIHHFMHATSSLVRTLRLKKLGRLHDVRTTPTYCTVESIYIPINKAQSVHIPTKKKTLYKSIVRPCFDWH